eukprot:4801329-Prymnesium_polylepis.1
MASRGLRGRTAGKRSEGCSRELCEAKIAWRAHAISNEMWVLWGFAACARFDARDFRMSWG